MVRELTLAHLTLMQPPLKMIEAGHEAGFDSVGIRICPRRPGDDYFVNLLEAPGQVPEVRRHAESRGVRLSNVSAYQFYPEVDWPVLSRVVNITAELGSSLLVVNCFDPERSRFTERLGRYCEAARGAGIRIALEFMPYSHVRTLDDAVSLLGSLAAENAGVLLDALHLDRSGGRVADMAALDPSLIAFAQLCDARKSPLGRTDADLMAEARTARLPLGRGALPLYDFVAALPASTEIEYEVAGLPGANAAEVARNALDDLRSFLLNDNAAAERGSV